MVEERIREGYKRTEVGLIPVDWEVEKLGNIVEIRSGESPSKFEIKKSGIPYFKVEQLNNSTKYQKNTNYFIDAFNPIKSGSIIFPKRGAAILTNKLRILSQDSFMDTNLMTLSILTNDHTEYIYYWLYNFGLWRLADTTSVPQINNKHIIPFLIPIPPLKEQKAIAEVLSDTDDLITCLQKLIDKKEKIKKGAMQKLLTGKE
ncbi:MAG TPA: hypothetical protein DHM42_05710, partial [Clostridiales bacterium]|nr:hypothetical protein [Clostridiales bacterium]